MMPEVQGIMHNLAEKMRTAGGRISSAACEISALRRVVRSERLRLQRRSIPRALTQGARRPAVASGSRQAAPPFVEKGHQDGCVDRSRLLAPGFRRSEHYKAPAVRCYVQIPKGVVSWPEERRRRPLPGFLRDEGVLIGRVAGDHDAVLGIHVEQFPVIARPYGELCPAFRFRS